MARQPSYPDDAPVEPARGQSEALAAAAEAKAAAGSKRNKHLMAGAAIGVGSAAIVAALLYANRGRKGG